MSNHPALNLPPAPLRIRQEGETQYVFDILREKWVVLTPEEWVRQHFTSWMRTVKGYPSSLMTNEKGIEVNGIRRRCDTIIFDKNGAPLIIIEYKAPDVKIVQEVFDQIVRYNMALKASYLIVSNGMNHYCCRMDYANSTYHFIPRIPDYTGIILPISEN